LLLNDDNPESGQTMRFGSVFENKGDLHLYAILGDLPGSIDDDFLILDPGTPDMRKRFLGACNPYFDGIVETLG
jgi:hypothetical protein